MNRSLAVLLVPFLLHPQETSDVTKKLVELPLEHALASAPAPDKVAPGLVRWHPDFASACDAARRSRKPVLLFQLLGRLDEEFC